MRPKAMRQGGECGIQERKRLSHQRSEFPSARAEGIAAGLIVGTDKQGAGEFQSDQMVTLLVGYPYGLGAQSPASFGKRTDCAQGRAGDLQHNLRRTRQGAAEGDQGAARPDIEGGGKLKKFLTFIVAATNKDGDRQGQAYPFATFCGWLLSAQESPSEGRLNLGFVAPRGPNRLFLRCGYGQGRLDPASLA